jgi:hypothetical protein
MLVDTMLRTHGYLGKMTSPAGYLAECCCPAELHARWLRGVDGALLDFTPGDSRRGAFYERNGEAPSIARSFAARVQRANWPYDSVKRASAIDGA